MQGSVHNQGAPLLRDDFPLDSSRGVTVAHPEPALAVAVGADVVPLDRRIREQRAMLTVRAEETR